MYKNGVELKIYAHKKLSRVEKEKKKCTLRFAFKTSSYCENISVFCSYKRKIGIDYK